MRHISVLTKETLEALLLTSGDNVIDCTLGDGGHAEAMLEIIKPNGLLLGIDTDPESLLRAKRYLYRFGEQVIFVRDNFSNLESIVKNKEIKSIKAIVMDLGWSSPQFEERLRGFSFEKDEQLDMRFFPSDSDDLTAQKIINQWSIKELDEIFSRYGEEKFSLAIAEEIINSRKNKKIISTKDLVEVILKVYRNKLHSQKEIPWIKGNIHPATKVFQALRIAVNNELEVLKQALPQAFRVLSPGGRLAVISFHSLEDRIVKRFFTSLNSDKAKIITKKPIKASDAELNKNNRARSAKLRVIEKI